MKRFSLLLLAILLLSSCAADLKTDYVSAKAYYFSAEDTASIIPTPVTLNMTDEADISLKLFSMLYSTDKKTLRPIIPSAIKLISLDVSDKVCSIELSDYYSKLSPTNKAAIDTCITKSLCSLPFIDSVTIICNGFSFPMREDSFVITTPVASYDILSVNLYYADPTFTDVVCKTEEFPLIPDESLEFAVVSKLFNTPDPTLCQSVFPKGTKLNKFNFGRRNKFFTG